MRYEYTKMVDFIKCELVTQFLKVKFLFYKDRKKLGEIKGRRWRGGGFKNQYCKRYFNRI